MLRGTESAYSDGMNTQTVKLINACGLVEVPEHTINLNPYKEDSTPRRAWFDGYTSDREKPVCGYVSSENRRAWDEGRAASL